MKSSSKSMPAKSSAKTPTVTPAKARGRPRTLQRDHVINVAMESYWVSGPSNVSVNDICKRANVSKPGLYREFGNEDGLQKEVQVREAAYLASAAALVGQRNRVLRRAAQSAGGVVISPKVTTK